MLALRFDTLAHLVPKTFYVAAAHRLFLFFLGSGGPIVLHDASDLGPEDAAQRCARRDGRAI